MRPLRKHRVALIALAVYHFAFFFPTLFMHRILSPNDVFYNFDPWSTVRSVEAQNSLLNDPPTSYFTLMSLLKHDWRAFHWNPYVASGVPGFGSSASAVLSPFILLPTLVLPLAWVYTGIIFLKLNVAFWFTYLWLREERLGKGAAAVGAILFAASGALAVRWLWQTTNAAALFPALLWIARRRHTPFWVIFVIALAYALAGFPASMAYGAWLAVIYALIRPRLRPIATAIMATMLALLIAAPSLVPFFQFVRRSGYLSTRSNASLEHAFPVRHIASFVSPDRLGNPAYHNWNGDGALGILNNYVEATVYLGLIAIPLSLIAIANRRARSRWFWLATAAIALACMFGVTPIVRVIGALPGFKYSPLTRLQIVLPLATAYLSAAGCALLARRWRLLVPAALAVIAAGDLAVFAGRFYPYLEPAVAMPPSTPLVAFLQSQPRPFRIAPFFITLWPNTSELYELEDVRSHFSSEAKYRRLLGRIDPTSFANNSTVIGFNSLKFDFADPLTSMLGVRYYVEKRDIDIIKWTTFRNTVLAGKPTTILPGALIQQSIRIDAGPFYAIELPIHLAEEIGPNPRIVVTLLRGNTVLSGRAFTPSDIKVMNKMYVPVRPFARAGDTLTLRVESIGIRGEIVVYGRVTVPVVFDRELPDARIFRNASELPRFWSVSRLRKMSEDALIQTKNIDFSQEAIVDSGGPLSSTGLGNVKLLSYREDEQKIEVDGPTFLASSEKLTPELRVTIDGRDAKPVEINMLFAGVSVPAGRHEVIFSRRIGRGWWWLSAVAAMAAMALSVIDVVRR
ncbi:MAG TPA: hypothetical protein VER58_01950 [Thermoanaerobaculia bacterium]|nr:hypothetical protein [Thermoanaerobaculia bacterium]